MTITSKRRIAVVVLATLVAAAAVFVASSTFVLDDAHGVGIQGVGNTGNG